MEEYKKSVNVQHASQELVERTLGRIREEEKQSAIETSIAMDESVPIEKGQFGKKSGRRMLYSILLTGTAALAACLAIVINISFYRPRLSYNPVSTSMIRGGLPEGNREELTIEEYEAYLGVDLTRWLAEYPCSNYMIYVSYGEAVRTDSQNIQKDEGTFYLTVDDHVVILKTSKSGLVLPEGLLTRNESIINGILVNAGVETESGELLAACNLGEVQYYLISNDMSKKEFEQLLEDLLQEEE